MVLRDLIDSVKEESKVSILKDKETLYEGEVKDIPYITIINYVNWNVKKLYAKDNCLVFEIQCPALSLNSINYDGPSIMPL